MVVARERRRTLRSTESKKRMGTWDLAHSPQSAEPSHASPDPRLRQDLDVKARLSSVPPCTCTNYDLHEILIGVDSGTHDQLTKGDTAEQTETLVQHPRSNHFFVGQWKHAERPSSLGITGLASPAPCLGESVRDVLQNPGDPPRHGPGTAGEGGLELLAACPARYITQPL